VESWQSVRISSRLYGEVLVLKFYKAKDQCRVLTSGLGYPELATSLLLVVSIAITKSTTAAHEHKPQS